jgi:hypothetical protein
LHSLNDSLAVVGLVRDDYGGRAVEAAEEGEHQPAVVLVGAVAFPVKLGVAVIALHV